MSKKFIDCAVELPKTTDNEFTCSRLYVKEGGRMIKGDLISSIRIEKGDKLCDVVVFLEKLKEKMMLADVEMVALNNFEIIFGDKNIIKEKE